MLKEGNGTFAPSLLLCALILAGTMLQRAAFVGVLLSGKLIMAGYWVAVIFIWSQLPRSHTPGKLRLKGKIQGLALVCVSLFILLRFVVGIAMEALAKSPYSLTPYGIMFNLLNILPPLTARELIRSTLVGTASRAHKHRFAWLALCTVFLALVTINTGKIATLNSLETASAFAARELLPALAQSCLLTVLCYYGGSSCGLIFSGGLAVFTRIFPVLPDLPWIAEGALGLSLPVLMAFYVRDSYENAAAKNIRIDRKNAAFVGALAVSVMLLWFVVGVFPIYPSVILTGSMEPGIMPGDIVLIKKPQEEAEVFALAPGDIITFRRGEITITHRILEVLTDEAGNSSFITKGDNNDSPDNEIVFPNDIQGVVRYVVPKIGLPVMLIHSGLK